MGKKDRAKAAKAEKEKGRAEALALCADQGLQTFKLGNQEVLIYDDRAPGGGGVRSMTAEEMKILGAQPEAAIRQATAATERNMRMMGVLPPKSEATPRRRIEADASLLQRAAAQPASDDADIELRNAVARIKLTQPGLVSKQVHAELQKVDATKWEAVTISEVKRMCSKLAKQEVAEKSGEAGPWQHLVPTQEQYAAGSAKSQYEVARDVMQDPLTRDCEQFKMARPGLPTHGTTLQRGDRLGTASERGDTQQVKKLLKKGVDPNYQNAASGVTPLGVACERGHTGVVRALLDAGADPEIGTNEGYRPIHIAAQFGKKEIIELLIRRGNADVGATCPLQDTHPLLLAANFDFTEVLRVLLAAGAHPDQPSVRRGLTAMHYAFSAEAVCALVAAKGDVNHQANQEGASPLHSACSAGCPDVCVALIACGADPTLRDASGMKPVELALDTGGASEACAHVILGYFDRAREIVARMKLLTTRHGPRCFNTPGVKAELKAITCKQADGFRSMAALEAPKSDTKSNGKAKVGAEAAGGGASGGGTAQASAAVTAALAEAERLAAELDAGLEGELALAGVSPEDAAAEDTVALVDKAGKGADLPESGPISLEQVLLARVLCVPTDEVTAAGKQKITEMLGALGAGGDANEIIHSMYSHTSQDPGARGRKELELRAKGRYELGRKELEAGGDGDDADGDVDAPPGGDENLVDLD